VIARAIDIYPSVGGIPQRREDSMTKRVIVFCMAVLAAVTLSAAANVAGTWKVNGDIYGNPVKFDCALKQDGAALTGTAKSEDGKEVPVTGTLKDKIAVFEFDSEAQGSIYRLVFTGTIGDDGGMKGTIAVAGVEGTFTATRQAAR
jgi:hypothetical protein